MAQINLSCRPGKESDKLIFPSTVDNPSGVDVYVMDAMPTVHRTAADGSPRGDAGDTSCTAPVARRHLRRPR